MLRFVAKEGGDKRVVYLVDSHVSRSIMSKGRSSSATLQRMLKTAASLCLAYGIYPAGRFVPTRLNPADHPSRGTTIPCPLASLLDPSRQALRYPAALASIAHLRRWTSNWVRLTLLLSVGILDFLVITEACRRHPLNIISNQEWTFDFDSTLGFPGEGPSSPSWILFVFLLALGFQGVCSVVGRESHGDALRRQQRSGIVLDDGRRVTQTTAFHREGLLLKFQNWLTEKGFSFDQLVMHSPPDLDGTNQQLVNYGRCLFAEGKPYYHFAETINAVVEIPSSEQKSARAWTQASAMVLAVAA